MWKITKSEIQFNDTINLIYRPAVRSTVLQFYESILLLKYHPLVLAGTLLLL